MDQELEQKVKKATEKMSENVHIVANEPSLAFYRLQEHVRKTLPQLVEKRLELNRMHQDLQGKCYDAEYAVNTIKSMQASSVNLENIQTLLKNAIFTKQQLTYEENRRQDRRSQTNNVYLRLSSMSLDFSETAAAAALRPIAAALSSATSSTQSEARVASSQN